MRTIFPMIKLIDDVEKYAKKDYWILNYSNPAAIVSEACRKLRPKARIINICDMPIAIIDVVAAAMGIQNKKEIVYDYFGLNHFGWFTSIQYHGEDLMPKLRAYIKENKILLPESYLKGMGALTSSSSQNRHTKGSWYYVWKGEYEIMENFPEYLPNTYLNYYLQAKEFVEHSDPNHTRANEVEETREKNLFDGIDHYLKTGEVDANTFYAGSHGDWIADLSAALKNDTKARFLIITENRGAIPNMPYDAMVELPAYIGKKRPGGHCPGQHPAVPAGLDDATAQQRKAAGRGLCGRQLREGIAGFHPEQNCAQHERCKGHSGRYDRSQQGLLAGAALSSRPYSRRRHCRLRRLFYAH